MKRADWLFWGGFGLLWIALVAFAVGRISLGPIVGLLAMFLMPEIRRRLGPITLTATAFALLAGISIRPAFEVMSIAEDRTMSASEKTMYYGLYGLLGLLAILLF